MAVDRLSNLAPGLSQAQPPPNRAVREAQAAFFQAALGKVQAPAASEARAAAPPTPAQGIAPARPAAEPKSGYRPGSLLDIRI